VTPHRSRLMMPPQWNAGFFDVLWVAIVAAAYVAAAETGFAFAFATKQVTAIWPPTGIALAAFLLGGTKIWPGVFLGAFVSNAISHEPVYTAAGIAVGNTIGPLFGAYLLRRVVEFDISLSRLRDVLGLALFGSALPMIVSATNGVVNWLSGDSYLGRPVPRSGGSGGSGTAWVRC
jgi:integral membrane sensor domain MASE1